MPKPGGRDRWTTLIGILKLLKGIFLLCAAIGVFKLAKGDVGDNLSRWTAYLDVDPNNQHFQKVLSKLTSVSPATIKAWGIGTFFYSLLFLIEGVGLLLQKRWAEYFTVIVTGSFIPLEIYELIKKFSTLKVLILLSNVAIVVYLVWRLRHSRKDKPK